MARVELPIVALNTTTGAPVSGASVQVKFRSSGLNATWYTQETGGTSSTAAITTDSAGRTNAWVDRGAYNCVVSGTGITTYTEPFDAAPAGDSTIDGLWLPDNIIVQRMMADASIGTAELIDANVTLAKLAPNSVDTSKIVDGTIGSGDLGTSALNAFMKLAVAADRKIAFSSGGAGSFAFNASGDIATQSFSHGLGTTPIAVFATQAEGGNFANGVRAAFACGSRSGTTLNIDGTCIRQPIAPTVAVNCHWVAIA
jgi:hypothetical protein